MTSMERKPYLQSYFSIGGDDQFAINVCEGGPVSVMVSMKGKGANSRDFTIPEFIEAMDRLLSPPNTVPTKEDIADAIGNVFDTHQLINISNLSEDLCERIRQREQSVMKYINSIMAEERLRDTLSFQEQQVKTDLDRIREIYHQEQVGLNRKVRPPVEFYS